MARLENYTAIFWRVHQRNARVPLIASVIILGRPSSLPQLPQALAPRASKTPPWNSGDTLSTQACARMANYSEDSLQIDISEEEKDKLVAEVIRSVLFKMHQSSGCPIKRDELTHIITKNYRQRSLPAFIINEARNKLASIFGYEMKELQRCRPSSSKQGRPSQQSVGDMKSYILVSKLPADVYSNYVENKENSHIIGFTFAVVSVVHLAGGKISEEYLWHHLRRLGLNENDENHPLFGNVKQALESLVQQRYLQKEKSNGPEGNNLMYELAERALDESFSEKLKEYIAQIANRNATTAEVDD